MWRIVRTWWKRAGRAQRFSVLATAFNVVFFAVVEVAHYPKLTMAFDVVIVALCCAYAIILACFWRRDRQLARRYNRVMLARITYGGDISNLPPDMQEEIRMGRADVILNYSDDD